MIKVEHVTALVYLREMKDARTRPGLFTCIDSDDIKNDYVVKYCHQLRSHAANELVSAMLGRHLGLPIPPAAVVELDQRLVDTIPDLGLQARLRNDTGPHFGSRFVVAGYAQPVVDIPLQSALDVFAFDMMIQNVDRQKIGGGKPNLLFNGTETIVFDHELAFSFTELLISQDQLPKPWELRGQPWVVNHLFFDRLRRTQPEYIDFSRVLAAIQAVSDRTLWEIESAIPRPWLNSDHLSKITSHIVAIRDNINQFERGLMEALA